MPSSRDVQRGWAHIPLPVAPAVNVGDVRLRIFSLCVNSPTGRALDNDDKMLSTLESFVAEVTVLLATVLFNPIDWLAAAETGDVVSVATTVRVAIITDIRVVVPLIVEVALFPEANRLAVGNVWTFVPFATTVRVAWTVEKISKVVVSSVDEAVPLFTWLERLLEALSVNCRPCRIDEVVALLAWLVVEIDEEL
jgi:hypothetical protein